MSANVRALRHARLADEQRDALGRGQHRTRSTSWSWSGAAVAKRLGWSDRSYSDFELAKRAVSVADLVALAHVFDVSPMALLIPAKPRSGARIEVAVPKTRRVLAAVTVREYQSWLRGLAPLPGQSMFAFTRNYAQRREAVDRTDARETIAPAELRALSAIGEQDPEAVAILRYGQYLDWLRRRQGQPDYEEGLEHFRELMTIAEEELVPPPGGGRSQHLTWRGAAVPSV